MTDESLLQKMARCGVVIGWYPPCEDFRPIEISDNDSIGWWHDLCNCSSNSFEEAVNMTYSSQKWDAS